METQKAVAEKLTEFAAIDPVGEFAHFLILDEGGNIFCADRGAATWEATKYEPVDEVREILIGQFFILARQAAALRGRNGTSRASSAGELRACMLSYENWVVTIRLLHNSSNVKRFLVGISTNAEGFVYGSARRTVDQATKAAEAAVAAAVGH